MIDSLKAPRYKLFRGLLVVLMTAFLCFGYMTGSDWRYYELIYNGEMSIPWYSISELGFSYLLSFAHHIIHDFWVFNAICKIAFLWSFIQLSKCFTNNEWTSAGIAFVFSLLFLLIDCPLRFMIALTFVQFGICAIVNQKLKLGIVLLVISTLFHVTTLIIISLLLSFFLLKRIVRLPIIVLLIVYIVALVIPSISFFYDFLYSSLSFFTVFDRFQDAYSEYSVLTYRTLGFWKNAILGSCLILSKKHVLSLKNGDALFYYSFLFFVLSGFLSCIPTGFRLNIINGFFVVFVIVNLINKSDFLISYKPIIKIVGIIALIVLVSHTVKNNWKYTPYSNSIRYILTDHLPYSYRDTYNLSNHQE